jgi:hypothetical protein
MGRVHMVCPKFFPSHVYSSAKGKKIIALKSFYLEELSKKKKLVLFGDGLRKIKKLIIFGRHPI